MHSYADEQRAAELAAVERTEVGYCSQTSKVSQITRRKSCMVVYHGHLYSFYMRVYIIESLPMILCWSYEKE